jgi:hypothetical protein
VYTGFCPQKHLKRGNNISIDYSFTIKIIVKPISVKFNLIDLNFITERDFIKYVEYINLWLEFNDLKGGVIWLKFIIKKYNQFFKSKELENSAIIGI